MRPPRECQPRDDLRNHPHHSEEKGDPVSSSSQTQKPEARYGDPDIFEITWQNGHVERVRAHQVSYPNAARGFFGATQVPQRVDFHAEIDGRWTLMLSALQDDLRTVRNVTNGEHITPEGGAA